MKNSFILKGDICFSISKDEIKTIGDAYLVVVDSLSKGVFTSLPVEYQNLEIKDHTGKLIIPGMIDLHIHAPQYPFSGTGMDNELLDWLINIAFKEEAKYDLIYYADKAYDIFTKNLVNSATTRASVFSTRHYKSTILLMDKLNSSRLITYVGKVNMDTHAPEDLKETSASESFSDTIDWLEGIRNKYDRSYPILTPRFIPSCSEELLVKLDKIQALYNLPVQSHLSENIDEIELVKKLYPKSRFYGDVYDHYHLFGKNNMGKYKTIMAHCVYSTKEEVKLIKDNGVFIAHCPTSNLNLTSGIAPIASYLRNGLKVGLGSDVAGGHTMSIFEVMVSAIQSSKMHYRYIDKKEKPLTFEECFYMATLGGGEFFSNVGSFLEGYEVDAIVIDDSKHESSSQDNLRERLERVVYLSMDKDSLIDKYVCGEKITLKK